VSVDRELPHAESLVPCTRSFAAGKFGSGRHAIRGIPQCPFAFHSLSYTFTVTGKEGQPPRAEEYTISSAMKLPDGDLWLLKSRVKYGDKDVTLPIPLDIKWAGDTPVITMTNMEIPGLGTFSTRVVLYEGRYAGTWQHGKVGGHLFGRIEKADAPKADAAKTEAK
jgi:hypothetical protein